MNAPTLIRPLVQQETDVPYSSPPSVRYYGYVDASGGIDACWPWIASVSQRGGYGKFWDGTDTVRAHRWGYENLIAHIPDGLEVCHTCDNPPCQNPCHWFLGTGMDNKRDRWEKGRYAVGDEHWASQKPELLARGEEHGNTTLTEDEVREIRATASEWTRQELADQYEVSKSTIKNILDRRTWGHVDGPSAQPRTKYGSTSLTEDDVREIRNDYATGARSRRELADIHEVSIGTVDNIVNRKTWRHVE